MAKADVWQGTLALMVLKTLDTLGPLHGYGIARRIEQTMHQTPAVVAPGIHTPWPVPMRWDAASRRPPS